MLRSGMNHKSLLNSRDLGYFLFFISMVVFFYHLSNINKFYFDEVHYIPAAKQWLQMAPVINTEHPPFGKYIIGGSINFFGDNPIGWRAASAFTGALAILLCYLIANLIFDDLVMAMSVGFFSLFNFWFFVQSRIAMLDIFMVTFFLSGIYYFLRYKFEYNEKKYFYISSFFWGLAVAIKWSAIFIYFPFFILCLYSEFETKMSNEQKRKVYLNFFIFGFFSIIIYFLTFIPYLFVANPGKRTLFEILFSVPLEMLKLQATVAGTHPYNSLWYTWPIILRPIWYEFSQSADHLFFKGIVLLANPWQMSLGILSVVLLLLRWRKIQSITKFTVVLFLCSWLAWPLAPRKISFFYYFFPSAVFYSFLIPMSLREIFEHKTAKIIMAVFTIISLGFFIYFYPILSGAETAESIRGQWYWLKSWI